MALISNIVQGLGLESAGAAGARLRRRRAATSAACSPISIRTGSLAVGAPARRVPRARVAPVTPGTGCSRATPPRARTPRHSPSSTTCSPNRPRRWAWTAASRSSAGSRRAPASRSGSRCSAAERPRPKAALAMSPALDTAAFDLDERRRPAGARAARDARSAHSRAAGACDSRASCARSACRPCTASTRWSIRSRSRACATRASWLDAGVRGRAARRAGSRRSGRAGAVGHDRAVGGRSAAERAPGDRRFLGAVVRALPAGVADRRDRSRRCAKASTKS